MKYYKIDEFRLLILLQAEDELLALHDAGVDNWGGGEFAYENMNRDLQDANGMETGFLDTSIELLQD